jgi:HAD superfamily hydrolase (TIGR01509 family)
MTIAQITHVVFDFDGVLLDSERQYSVANAKCLERYGCTFTVEMKAAMMGRRKEDAITTLLRMNNLLGKVTVEEYLSHYERLLEELIPLSPELPGASKLIDHFHACRIPLAICTGSDIIEFAQKTRRFAHWLEKIPIQVLAGSDPEVKYGKPHPDPYLVTFKRFPERPASPKNVLVFEDSINGARSSLAAGMTTVMIPQKDFLPPNWDEIHAELRPQLSDLLESLEEFNPTAYGLPSFDKSSN